MKRIISLIICIFVIAGALIIPVSAAEPAKSSIKLSELNGRIIGVVTGSIHDATARKLFPDSEIKYFSSVTDMAAALKSNAVDAFFDDIVNAYYLLAENDDLAYVEEPVGGFDIAYITAKDEAGNAMKADIDGFMTDYKESGKLQELQDKWLSYDSTDHEVDVSDLNDGTKKIIFATSCLGKPVSYYYEGKPVGYEVELMAEFCRARGYALDIQITDFAGLIPGVTTGKYDVGGDCIAITPERQESVNFSLPDFTADVVMIVKKDNTASAGLKTYNSIKELNSPDVNLGVATGMSTEKYYEIYTPDAQLKYYNGLADILYALSIGQIDGYMDDAQICKYLASTVPGCRYIDEPLGEEMNIGFMFGKTDSDKQLKAEFDKFVTDKKADGTIDKIIDKWCSSKDAALETKMPEKGDKGIIKTSLCSQSAPACFIQNNELAGYEVELFAMFCEEYGYGAELKDMDFGGLINAVTSGISNIAFSSVSITEERKVSVNFSEPYLSEGCLMLVRAPIEKESFFAGIAKSFERTFITEQRWKLIVQGIGTTVIISLGAALLGTILGFALCLLRLTKNKFLTAVTTVYIRVLQGTPLLVLLMILFYIVFSKSGVSGEFVAIIAFALNFAAYVCEMFRTGIEGVDDGQTEAALALGYTKKQTFLRIVMPQAAMKFMPVYKGEFISLVKMTSVVGYIAVQDLTKMSDIIRSRTYEAFFPLIATAIIYFILSTLLTTLLKTVEIKIEPKRNRKTLKGVDMK